MNQKLADAKAAYAKTIETGSTGDPVLDKVAAWCDEHGWDELDSPPFNDWLKEQGIDRSDLMIGKCRMPDWA